MATNKKSAALTAIAVRKPALVGAPTTDDAQIWATFVAEQMQLGMVAGATIAGGRALQAARERVKHGEWQRMFADHDNPVKNPLPFGHTTGMRLMKIADSKILTKGAHAHLLPTAWYTLYELTKVPEPRLERAFAQGLVTADMERGDVRLLMPPKHEDAITQEEAFQDLLDGFEAAMDTAAEYLLKLRPFWKKLDDGQVDHLRLVAGKASTKLTELETRNDPKAA